jgi:hypothetical protein
MALSSAAASGAASPGIFKGAVWAPYLEKVVNGCASVTSADPHWTKLTGAGKWQATTAAAVCSKARGGNTFESYSTAESELEVLSPIKLPSGTGGVNVTWNLVAAGSNSAGVVGTLKCPYTYYNYSYNYGYTWYNFSEVISECFAEGLMEVFGSAWVNDLTTNTQSNPTNYWTGVVNVSGVYNETIAYKANYSNSSYWASNYSYSYISNYSFAPSNSFATSWTPTWFVNGTFLHSNRYTVESYIEVIIASDAYGYVNSHATSKVNMATGGNHIDLLPYHVW